MDVFGDHSSLPSTPSSVSGAQLLLPSLGVSTPPKRQQRKAGQWWGWHRCWGWRWWRRRHPPWGLGRQQNEAGKGLGLHGPGATASLAAWET